MLRPIRSSSEELSLCFILAFIKLLLANISLGVFYKQMITLPLEGEEK